MPSLKGPSGSGGYYHLRGYDYRHTADSIVHRDLVEGSIGGGGPSAAGVHPRILFPRAHLFYVNILNPQLQLASGVS